MYTTLLHKDIGLQIDLFHELVGTERYYSNTFFRQYFNFTTCYKVDKDGKVIFDKPYDQTAYWKH